MRYTAKAGTIQLEFRDLARSAKQPKFEVSAGPLVPKDRVVFNQCRRWEESETAEAHHKTVNSETWPGKDGQNSENNVEFLRVLGSQAW